MKKRYFAKITFFILLCFPLMLTGCSESGKELINYVIEEGMSVSILESESTDEYASNSDHGNESGNQTINSTQAREIREIDETAGYLVKDLGGYYAYERLSDERKKLYDKIYEILAKRATEITVPTLDTTEIDYVFNCVLIDHPELFYVEGYSYSKYTVNGELNSIDFSGTYMMEEAEIIEKQEQIDQYVKEIYQHFPMIISQYDIAKYFYETIILNTEYRLNAVNNQNICSIFVTHESVCQGYAKALQYLLQLEGVECVLVTGQVTGGEGHAWIIANLDGAYYHIDPTWGDASYMANDTEEVYILPDINYDYLCVTTEEISKTHSIDAIVDYPNCISINDNYYVMEGLYFTEVDTDHLHEEFEQAYASGNLFLTLKCENENVYSQMTDYLLRSEDAHIFEYLHGGINQVTYSLNNAQCSVTIWLQ